MPNTFVGTKMCRTNSNLYLSARMRSLMHEYNQIFTKKNKMYTKKRKCKKKSACVKKTKPVIHGKKTELFFMQNYYYYFFLNTKSNRQGQHCTWKNSAENFGPLDTRRWYCLFVKLLVQLNWVSAIFFWKV